jgi:ribosomal protein L37AE/L43A
MRRGGGRLILERGVCPKCRGTGTMARIALGVYQCSSCRHTARADEVRIRPKASDRLDSVRQKALFEDDV